MRKVSRAVAALAALATLVPAGARADEHPTPCTPKVVVLGFVAGQAALNLHGLRCGIDRSGGIVDTRVLTPGATELRARYTFDLGPDVPVLKATIQGLGLDETNVNLFRVQQTPIGSFVYDSNVYPIGMLDQGCVTVTVSLPDGTPLDEASYRTVNGSC